MAKQAQQQDPLTRVIVALLAKIEGGDTSKDTMEAFLSTYQMAMKYQGVGEMEKRMMDMEKRIDALSTMAGVRTMKPQYPQVPPSFGA